MPVRLDSSSADFDQRFDEFLAAKREVSADVERATRAIVDDVAARGDAALIEATRKFDRLDLDAGRPARHRGRDRRRGEGLRRARPLEALKFARDRIETFHRRQMPKDERFTDALGVELGWRWSAIDAVGLYVPGGTAAYPSSVLMNAVPARVAGVRARGDGGAVARRQAQSAGAGGGASWRRLRDLPRRRRAGGGRARLWHGDDRAGRQDRRPRQCLCRRRQAAGVRQGRHRHDRRPLRSACHRRRHRQCRLDRRRSAGAGRARRQRAVDPDHRQRARLPPMSNARWRRSSRPCRARRSRAPRGTISAPSSW